MFRYMSKIPWVRWEGSLGGGCVTEVCYAALYLHSGMHCIPEQTFQCFKGMPVADFADLLSFTPLVTTGGLQIHMGEKL